MALLSDRGEMGRFVEALFRHADPDGYVHLRAFYENKDVPWRQGEWRSIRSHDTEGIITEALRIADLAATDPDTVVFCPPVATFLTKDSAAEQNVKNGLALLVDCDKDPESGRSKLESLLGPASLVVASGGIWEGQQKVHCYWVLLDPTRTFEEHELLKLARAYGAKYAGSDPTSGPISHPIRWAGTWHRKAEPRLAVILSESDNEIDLHTAFQLLKNAVGADEGPRHGSATEADPADLRAALEVIPNDTGLDWDGWNNIGMALWAATSGSDAGLKIWEEWSAKSPKDVPSRTRGRWRHFKSSPPSKIGAGTIFYLAVQNSPGWCRPGDHAPLHSDEALAVRFATDRMHDLRYTARWGRWHHWTGSYWREDRTLVSLNLAREFCRRVARSANKGAKALASARTVSNVSALVRADQRIAATTEQWDTDPWLMGTPGGTIDLQRGIVRANGVTDYITRVAAVTPGGDCPLWLDTLHKICGNNQDLVDYFQRISGYFLTGSVREEMMFFLHGEGGNGKGTFIETLGYVCGDYATTVAMSTLIMTKHSEHPTEIAKLCGSRLAVASETNDAARWNAAKIKLLTGGDALTGRFMRGDYFDFPPTHKLVVSSNKRPMLGRVDNAIARRTVMIPFNTTFALPDKTIKERLRAEAPGILAWQVDGCLSWQRWGLRAPDVVERATQEYLHDQDDIQMFIDECCEEDLSARTSSTQLYMAWQEWSQRNGVYPGSKKDFTQRMMPKFDHTLVQNLTHFVGVRLNQRDDTTTHVVPNNYTNDVPF